MRSLRILRLGFFCLVLLLWSKCIEVAYADGGGATPRCSCPPATIRVWRVLHGDGLIEDVELESYVEGVLRGELGNWANPWHLEAAKTEAIAARTYGTYHCADDLGDGVYGVFDDSRHQVYWPDYEVSAANANTFQQAVTDTQDIYIVYRGSLDALDPPHDFTDIGLPIEALFGADNGITTTSAYQESGSEYEYARSVHDPVSEGCLGHCWGFSQRGAQRWASQHGWSWQQILYHYYTNVEFQQKHAFTANYYNDGDTNPDNDFMPSKLVASQADVSVDYNWSGVPRSQWQSYCRDARRLFLRPLGRSDQCDR